MEELKCNTFINVRSNKTNIDILAKALQSEMGREFSFSSRKITKYRNIAARLSGYSSYQDFLSKQDTELAAIDDTEARIAEHIQNPSLGDTLQHLRALKGAGLSNFVCAGSFASDPNTLHDTVCSGVKENDKGLYLHFEHVYPRINAKDPVEFVHEDHDKCLRIEELIEQLESYPLHRLLAGSAMRVDINPSINDADWELPDTTVTFVGAISRLIGLEEAMSMARDGFEPIDLFGEKIGIEG